MKVVLALFSTLLFFSQVRSEEVLDAVVASVNGKAITLSEVTAKLRPPRSLTPTAAATDPEARLVLSELINEYLIREDAEARRLSVNADEVDRYINEVASRNELSPSAFMLALKEQGLTESSYRSQVELEILKGKVASAHLRGAVAISDADVDRFIADNPGVMPRETTVSLRRIFISFTRFSTEEAEQRAGDARARISRGDTFEEVAQEFSDDPETRRGALLPDLVERELNPTLFDALVLLNPGDVSAPLRSSDGIHILKLESRSKPGQSQELREEIRRRLHNDRIALKAQEIFSSVLPKQYPIERIF